MEMIHVVVYRTPYKKFIGQYKVQQGVCFDRDISDMNETEWRMFKKLVEENNKVWNIGLHETFYFKVGREIWHL